MKKVIVFDLDDTLAKTKSPITNEMSQKLSELLKQYEVCIISGGKFEQFQIQVLDCLSVNAQLIAKLHIMPTCGTRYYRFDTASNQWQIQYAEDLATADKQKIAKILAEAAKALGYWEPNPQGELIEDRGSQITISALGQHASPEAKYAWDPDDAKKRKIRDYAAERLPEFEVRVGGTTSIDVTKPGIDKAYGMKKLMAARGLAKADLLFIGDRLEEGGNDYPVKALGIECIAVNGYQDTPAVVEKILRSAT